MFMSLGLGVFLLVVGGIFAFGVRDQWSALDVTVIGYVLMAGGALAIILYFVVMNQRRTATRRDRGAPPAA